MKGIFELIKLLYGNILPRVMGKRTNVIRLPNNKIRRYAKEDLDIENATDAQVEKAYNEMKELVEDIAKLNDAEKKIFESNLRRLANRKGLNTMKEGTEAPSATVKSFETGKKIEGKGLESLRKERGRVTRPVEQPGEPKDEGILKLTEDLRDKAREVSEGLKTKGIQDYKFGNQPADRLIADKLGPEAKNLLSKKAPESFAFGQDYYDATNARVVRDAYKNYSPEEADKVVGYFNKLEDQDQLRRSMKQFDTALTPESIMRPAARAILEKFHKEGKIKLSPGTVRAMEEGGSVDSIDQFRKIFGDDNLEVFDDYIADTGFGLQGKSDSFQELADRFVKDYPGRLNKEFLKQTGGVLTPKQLPKQLLTDREKVNFLLNNDGEGNPLDPEVLDYLRQNIDPQDPFITKYIMQYALPSGGKGTSAKEIIKNLPEGYNPPDEVRTVLGIETPEPEGFAEGGSVGLPNILGV